MGIGISKLMLGEYEIFISRREYPKIDVDIV